MPRDFVGLDSKDLGPSLDGVDTERPTHDMSAARYSPTFVSQTRREQECDRSYNSCLSRALSETSGSGACFARAMSVVVALFSADAVVCVARGKNSTAGVVLRLLLAANKGQSSLCGDHRRAP